MKIFLVIGYMAFPFPDSMVKNVLSRHSSLNGRFFLGGMARYTWYMIMKSLTSAKDGFEHMLLSGFYIFVVESILKYHLY